MRDRLTKARRSWNMSRIRGKNTTPELVARSLLHRMGYRFRLHEKNLPGRPDIVLKTDKDPALLAPIVTLTFPWDSGTVVVMNDGKFSPRAEVLWGTIPKEARARLLANVFCANCSDIREIVDFAGSEENGDLVLRGACARCGYNVVRVIETSERDSSDN